MDAALIAGVSALVSGLVALAGIWLSRRSDREAHQTQEELGEFQILRGTVDALNTEVTRLQGKLKHANESADRLNRELDNAQANVLILSEHVRQYLPEVPFPKLRRMSDLG